MFDGSSAKTDRFRRSRTRGGPGVVFSMGLACTALACGPASTSRPPAVSTASSPAVSAAPPPQPGTASPEPLPSAPGSSAQSGIDRNDPRVVAAGAAIAAVVGHPIEVTVDAALMASLGRHAQDSFVAALEALVNAVRQMQHHNAEALAYAAPLWRQVLLQYEPSSDASTPLLETASGTLRVKVHPPGSLLGAYEVEVALYNAFDLAASARFTGRDPESIPASEQRAYYRFLSDSHSRPGLGPLAERSPLDRLQRLLRFYDRLVDGGVRTELRHRLAGFASSLSSMRKTLLPEGWMPAQKAYVAWVNTHGADFDFSDRRAIAEAMFGDARNDPDHAMREGLDLLRFATPILQALAAAPRERDGQLRDSALDPDERSVAQIVLCPAFETSWAEEVGVVRGCKGEFYDAVIAGPNGISTLARFLESFPSDQVTESAVLHLLISRGASRALDLIAASDDAGARLGLRALARYGWRAAENAAQAPQLEVVATWIRQQWSSRAKWHGPLLYALTQLDAARVGLVPWGNLAAWLGTSIGPTDLESFLDQGQSAMNWIGTIAPGFSAGWSRARVIIPRFERWMGTLRPADVAADTDSATRQIVEALCRYDWSDVAMFQAFVRERVETYPSESHQFARVPESKLAALCPSKPPPSQPIHPVAPPPLAQPIEVRIDAPESPPAVGHVAAAHAAPASPSPSSGPTPVLFAD